MRVTGDIIEEEDDPQREEFIRENKLLKRITQTENQKEVI